MVWQSCVGRIITFLVLFSRGNGESLLVLQDNPVSEDCRVMQFKHAIIDSILVSHVINSIRVRSEVGCEANCFENEDCMSVNLGPLEDGKHLCELSNSDHDIHPKDLKQRKSFTYKPVWNYCESNSCPSGRKCQTGFTGKGYRCVASNETTGETGNITDIDECATNAHNCSADAFCNNTVGSFNCTCKPGYSGNGTACTDIDECATNTYNCHFNASCDNTIGSHNCTCNPGYTGNGQNCTDINECTTNQHNCDVNAYCTDTVGSFNCTCNPGFTGTGTSCTDIDECATNFHNCSADAFCNNTVGSFNCTCKPGYNGNGTTCTGLRLAGGNWSGEGRVEIFHSGSWGTVCGDNWDINDVQVVCRELGYPNALSVPQSANFGSGNGQIWLDDVQCQGHESSIVNCPNNGWESHNCDHGKDASVICSGLRLVGGNWSGEGRVEILNNGSWGTVCDDDWDINDAQVVCRELGYPNTTSALQSAHFGSGNGQIWLDDVQCQGHESSIVNCQHNGWGSHNCVHSEDASVICSR